MWEKRNTDVGSKVEYDRLLHTFRVIEFSDKLDFLKLAVNIIADEHEQLTSEPEEPEIETISLSAQAKTRIKNLLSISMLFTGQSQKDLIKEGASEELITTINTEGDEEYTEEIWQTLTPFLCVPMQWANNYPAADPNSRFGDDVSSLLLELEQVIT